MRDYNSGVSRRRVLELTGGTLATAGLASTAGASDGLTEFNVGYSTAAGRRAAVDAGAEVKREFNFDALTIRATAEAAAGLENRPDVRYVEENGTWRALGQTTPYGIEKVDADEAHDDGETGDGAHVAVIDTGIDPNHEDLAANVGEGEAFASCRSGQCSADWDDDDGHGTHCAGTVGAIDNDLGVIGVAPDVTLHSAKVLDNTGRGSWDDIAAAIEWTADQGYDVGSMSLGGSSGSGVVADACEYADDEGVLLVAAAGNSGPCTDCVGYPAAYDEVVAVSATDENDDLAGFSSTGPEVELAAPGVGVLSTLPGDDYDEYSGTSMACPHVAGAGAILMANGASNDKARSDLHNGADDIGLDDNEQGHGRLNVADSL